MTIEQYEELYCTCCDSQRCANMGGDPIPKACPYWNMRVKGYDYCETDKLGGVHTDGVGYAPDGHFCGECTNKTCEGCWDKEKIDDKPNT